MLKRTWTHRVVDYRVHDGDTLVDVTLDLGHFVTLEGRSIRLTSALGPINAPETTGRERDAGRLVSAWVEEWVFGQTLWVRSESLDRDAYGRVIGRVFRGVNEPGVDDDPDESELGMALIQNGLAKMCPNKKRVPFDDQELDAILRALG